MTSPPPGLRIETHYAAPEASPLWLPPRLRRRARAEHGPTEIIVPPSAEAKKLVYFKGRLYAKDPSLASYGFDGRWYGGIRRVPYHLGLDEAGHDGLSLRYQIKLYIAGLLERVSGGRWIYQESDEMDVNTAYDEVPERAHSVETWARFFRWEG